MILWFKTEREEVRMQPKTFEQTLDMEILGIIMLFQDKGVFRKIRVIPPQSSDDEVLYGILAEALFSVGRTLETYSDEKRTQFLIIYTVLFMMIITNKINNVPPHVANLIPDHIRDGRAYYIAR